MTGQTLHNSQEMIFDMQLGQTIIFVRTRATAHNLHRAVSFALPSCPLSARLSSLWRTRHGTCTQQSIRLCLLAVARCQ